MIKWFKYSSPTTFYPLAGSMLPWFYLVSILLSGFGLYWGFFKTPDILTEQKEYYRIIYVHVPAAWMSMWLYIVMAFWAIMGLIFNTRLSFMMAAATAPTGAVFTALALLTGMIWGKTSWGTWWDWDPRMTMELVLLFLYVGFMALQSAIEEPQRADRATALLAIVGLICVPLIYWSVNCPDPNECAALHARSSMSKIDPNIRLSMLVMVFAFWMYSFAVIFARARNIILERERHTGWIKELLGTGN